jgi:protein-L-isoaspartate O-methyltransferase
LLTAVAAWWREQRQTDGRVSATITLIAIGFEFLRDSFPDRRRQRFGDTDYDWEHRVDTTSANISWQSRLIGLLNSPYQPVEPALFREMMNTLAIEFERFTFIDIGSGKGRAVLLASEYPFQRILGIELLPELHLIAQRNLHTISSATSRRPLIRTICGDATEFVFPEEPVVIFLNNSLPEAALRRLIDNLENSLREKPRSIVVLYANPILEPVINDSRLFQKLTGTHQYAIFGSEV